MSALPGWHDLSTVLEGTMASHCMRDGEVPILMVHGVGPGTNGITNFAPLLDRLDGRFAPHLIDLAGFGASGRRQHPPLFDVAFWLRQISQALDRIQALHGKPALLVGNSVGGALVLKVAADRPELRQLLVIGAPAWLPAPTALRGFWRAPRDMASLAAAMAPMTAGAAGADPVLVAARLQPFLDSGYGDYFDAMLAEPDACLASVLLQPDEAARIGAHVQLVHGREDRACPVAHTLDRLLPLLPRADITLLGDCGHTVLSERLDEVVATIERLTDKGRPS